VEVEAARAPEVPVVFTSGLSDDSRRRGHPIIEGANASTRSYGADALRGLVAGASG
jgi:hypothetical protein